MVLALQADWLLWPPKPVGGVGAHPGVRAMGGEGI